MKTDVLAINGSKTGKGVELPAAFETEVDEALIRRAVLAAQSARLQRKAPLKGAGRLGTAEYVGRRSKPQRHRTINIGHARLPRAKNRRYVTSGDVASVSQAVGGPKPHGPKVEKRLIEKINRKERRKAIAAAVAAAADEGIVKERGHRFGARLPVVVEGRFEKLEKTKEVEKALKALKLWSDVERAKKSKRTRSGKGKRRGRRYKQAKSLLIVAEKPERIYLAARNLAGVDVVSTKGLNAELLAPGTKPGRLTLWTEPAVRAM